MLRMRGLFCRRDAERRLTHLSAGTAVSPKFIPKTDRGDNHVFFQPFQWSLSGGPGGQQCPEERG